MGLGTDMKQDGKGSFLLLVAGVVITVAVAYLDSLIPRHAASIAQGAGFAIMSLIACCFGMRIEEIFLVEEDA